MNICDTILNDFYYKTPLLREIDCEGSGRAVLTHTFENHVVPIHQRTEKLRKNLQVALETIKHVPSVLRFSDNNLKDRSGISNLSQEDTLNLDFQYFFLEAIRDHTTPKIGLQFAKALGLGRCDEMRQVGAEFIRKNHRGVRVEMGRIENGDHGFLIVGRDPSIPLSEFIKAPLSDPSAVFLDCWNESFFPAPLYKIFLMDYIDFNKISAGRFYTQVRKFNEKNQTVQIKGNPKRLTEEEFIQTRDRIKNMFSFIQKTENCDIKKEIKELLLPEALICAACSLRDGEYTKGFELLSHSRKLNLQNVIKLEKFFQNIQFEEFENQIQDIKTVKTIECKDRSFLMTHALKTKPEHSILWKACQKGIKKVALDEILKGKNKPGIAPCDFAIGFAIALLFKKQDLAETLYWMDEFNDLIDQTWDQGKVIHRLIESDGQLFKDDIYTDPGNAI